MCLFYTGWQGTQSAAAVPSLWGGGGGIPHPDHQMPRNFKEVGTLALSWGLTFYLQKPLSRLPVTPATSYGLNWESWGYSCLPSDPRPHPINEFKINSTL